MRWGILKRGARREPNWYFYGVRRYYFLLLICCLLGAQTLFAKNAWESYALPVPFRGAALSGEKLWVATPAGIRVMDRFGKSELYSSEDGLETADQADVFALPDGEVLGVSDRGLIARKSPTGSFRVVNRSFAETDRKLYPGIGKLAWPVLLLPFEGSLALFDLKTGRAVLSLVQIGSRRIENHPVTALLVRGDTAYVALGDSVYCRSMRWDSLAQDRSLADPSTWTQVLPGAPVDTVRKMAFRGDSLVVSSQTGSLAIDALGRETSSCSDSLCVVRVRGEVRSDADFYGQGRSLVDKILEDAGGRLWFVGSEQVWVDDGSLHLVSEWEGFPLSLVHTLASDPAGGVVAWSLDKMVRNQGGTWGSAFQVNATGYPDDSWQNFAQPLKSLSVGGNGTVAVGLWGAGLLQLGTGAAPELENWYSPVGSGCITGYDGGDYTLVRGVTATPDGSGYLFSYVQPESVYGLGYLGHDGVIRCVGGLGRSSHAGMVEAKASADGSVWDIYVAWGASLATSGEGGVDHYRVSPPATQDGSFAPFLEQQIYSMVGYPRDFSLSPDGSRLWVAGISSLGYWEPGDSVVKSVPYLQGYSGGELTAIALDVQGGIWLGTLGKGAYRLSMLNASPDSLVAVQYLPRNGLLSTRVYDIALDPVQGMVWFGQDVGVSSYRYVQVRDASAFMQAGAPPVVAFPNPFRPGVHNAVNFENLREDAVLYLLDAAGNKVCVFKGEALRGGRIVWDGTNSQGKWVAPGLYHYWVVAAGKTARGKLMVEY